MQNAPLEKRTRKRNLALGLVLAVFVMVLVGLAVYWVSPESASGTDSLLSGMK